MHSDFKDFNLPNKISFRVDTYSIFIINFGEKSNNNPFTLSLVKHSVIYKDPIKDLKGIKFGLLRAFYKKYSKFHFYKTDSIPESTLKDLVRDIEVLKSNYDYFLEGHKNRGLRCKKAINIGSFEDSGLSLHDILNKVSLNEKLNIDLTLNNRNNRKIKV